MSACRVVLLIIGALLTLAAVGMIATGIVITVAYATQRDDDGFFTSRTYDLRSAGHALVSEEVDIAPRGGDWWPAGLATVRFRVEPLDPGPVFIGIGPSDDVDGYLSGVSRDQITDLGDNGDDVTYRSFDGGGPPGPPGGEQFWAIFSEGEGVQTLTWEVERGSWSVVIMNADGSPIVEVSAQAGGKSNVILPAGIGLIVGGLLLLAIAIVLMVLAIRNSGQSTRTVAYRRPEGQRDGE